MGSWGSGGGGCWFFSRRAHEHADRGRGLVVRRRGLVHRLRLVDPEQRRDGGGPDVEDPGVGDLTVNLHHHFVVFVLYDALVDVHRWQHHGHLGSASFVVAGGRKEEVVLAERHHVERVAAAMELLEEVAVCVMRRVVNLQLTARILFLSVCVLDGHNLGTLSLFTLRFQDGLGWFVIAVTGALRLGLQRFVPVDPASQLVGQL